MVWVHDFIHLLFLVSQEEDSTVGGAEEQPEQDAGPDDDADYEYMEDGAQREAGETQALGPATEEQAAELHGTNRPDQGAHCSAHTRSFIRPALCTSRARSIHARIAQWLLNSHHHGSPSCLGIE